MSSSFLEAAVLVGIVVGIGVLAWVITSRVNSSSVGPTPEQRPKVAQNFMRGAQLMGRCNNKGKSIRASEETSDGRPMSADSVAHGPSKDELRAAVRCFNEGLHAYPNDFSTRFLKAQALEELGELTEALTELDWLLSQRASVKPNFFRRMAMALGVLEPRSVAPLGTTLVSKCEVDLVVFHIRKRKGRVLLKKRRVTDALRELKLASNILDRLAWDEEVQRREDRVNSRMKTLKQHAVAGKESLGSALPLGVTKTTRASGPEEDRLLNRSDEKTGNSATYQETASGKTEDSSGFKIPPARAELDLLLARCHEELGNFKEAVKILEGVLKLGHSQVQMEATIALAKIEEKFKNEDKSE